MERIEQYRQFIRQLLTSHATPEQNSDSDVECQLVFDTEQDHYQILDVGWEGYKRIYNCFIHLDIKDGKIWIQRNMTEDDSKYTRDDRFDIKSGGIAITVGGVGAGF
jgi:XisI protein